MSEDSNEKYINCRIVSSKSFVGQGGTFFTIAADSILSDDTILKDEVTGYDLRLMAFIKESEQEFYYLFSIMYAEYDDMLPNYTLYDKTFDVTQIQGIKFEQVEGEENENKGFDYVLNFIIR